MIDDPEASAETRGPHPGPPGGRGTQMYTRKLGNSVFSILAFIVKFYILVRVFEQNYICIFVFTMASAFKVGHGHTALFFQDLQSQWDNNNRHAPKDRDTTINVMILAKYETKKNWLN